VNAAQLLVRHRFTAYAATDARFLRIGLLSFLPTDAWPIADARLVERERRRGRHRVRVEIRKPGARRRGVRFRISRVKDLDGLRAALRTEGESEGRLD
jgi:hypothetical protein